MTEDQESAFSSPLKDRKTILMLERVDVPEGLRLTFEEADSEVVLGRGPLLRITDRKISRRQCRVVFSRGPPNGSCWKLLATSTSKEEDPTAEAVVIDRKTARHPCYHLSSGEERWRKIEDEVSLESGDRISLAEEGSSYVYKVHLVVHKEKSEEDMTEADTRVVAGTSGTREKAFLPPKNGKMATLDPSDDGEKELSSLMLSSQPQPMSDDDDDGPVEEDHRPQSNLNRRRKSCSYGEACYRKNPQHRIEEAHPGDPDYHNPEEVQTDDTNVEGADGSDDPRPECEHGLNCYRNNPQHKKDFKHTTRPRPKRKAKEKASKVKKKTKADHITGDGDDEYESSFIDDEEEEDDEQDISSDEEDVEEWRPEDDD